MKSLDFAIENKSTGPAGYTVPFIQYKKGCPARSRRASVEEEELWLALQEVSQELALLQEAQKGKKR